MTQQFNYFAIGADEKVVCKILFSVLRNIYVLPERGSQEQMIPRQISTPMELLASEIGDFACIIPKHSLPFITLREIPYNLYRVDFQAFPCIEYTSSRSLATKTAKVGRIVYFYEEATPFKANVQKLFRVLKKNSQKIVGKPGFWIFEQTAREVEKLHYWVGTPKLNPMYEK